MAIYPAALKTWVDKVDLTDFMTAGILNDDVMDEIIAVETELGTDPAGAYATVDARLDAELRDANKLQSRNIASDAPADGQALVWDNAQSRWEPGTIGGIPSGLIGLWHGTIANIPSGYVICDGNNSTPNLLDKFVKSVPTAATNPGTTGGASTHTLTVAELAAHTHTDTGYISEGSDLVPAAGNSIHATRTLTSDSTGGGSAHENEPQHYEVAFIMKT